MMELLFALKVWPYDNAELTTFVWGTILFIVMFDILFVCTTNVM